MSGEKSANSEIEVTAEMKAAGADFLDIQLCEGGTSKEGMKTLEWQAEAIFRLMAALCPKRYTPET
jgi:hypothetical protein